MYNIGRCSDDKLPGHQYIVHRVASEISIGGYSGVAGGEASSRQGVLRFDKKHLVIIILNLLLFITYLLLLLIL